MLLGILLALLVASQVLAKSVTNQNKNTKQITIKSLEKPKTYALEQLPPKIEKVAQNEPVQATDTCPSDPKQFIYCHESRNNPSAINATSGSCGLGQALPCSKLTCSLTDYNCQDLFFTQYMRDRYTTWENAKQFWLINGWW